MDQNRLRNYEIIETQDGSQTYYSKVYGEACHSTSGATSETILHYIKGCNILEQSKVLDEIFVLEVGFGTGIGFKETLNCTRNTCKLNFQSFEIDSDLIEYFFEQEGLNFILNDDVYLAEGPDFKLTVLSGNARESIAKINQKFHAIYQDAFSPKRNAILWTTEWFKDLLKFASPDCIMSTYSASSSVRKAMVAAGWKVYNGEKFGVKRSSTRARISGETEEEIMLHLNRSPAITITDKNYKEYTLG